MKPLGGFAGYNSEWRELAQVISRVRTYSRSSVRTSRLLEYVLMLCPLQLYNAHPSSWQGAHPSSWQGAHPSSWQGASPILLAGCITHLLGRVHHPSSWQGASPIFLAGCITHPLLCQGWLQAAVRGSLNLSVGKFTVARTFCLQEIYSHNPDVKWDDIIGLDNAKRLVKEAVVYPIKVRCFPFASFPIDAKCIVRLQITRTCVAHRVSAARVDPHMQGCSTRHIRCETACAELVRRNFSLRFHFSFSTPSCSPVSCHRGKACCSTVPQVRQICSVICRVHKGCVARCVAVQQLFESHNTAPV